MPDCLVLWRRAEASRSCVCEDCETAAAQAAATTQPPSSTSPGAIVLAHGPSSLSAGWIVQELLERPVVRSDGGRVGVFVGAVQAVAAGAENDGVSALLVVEASVCGTVLTQEIGAVPLVGHGLLEPAYLGTVPVGLMRRVGMIDQWGNAGLAEGRQIC